MKIISTKEYNKLMKMKSDYLDLLWKPFQGVFEKVTDDDLLRENGLLNAENERLNNIINNLEEYSGTEIKYWEKEYKFSDHYDKANILGYITALKNILNKIKELKGVKK